MMFLVSHRVRHCSWAGGHALTDRTNNNTDVLVLIIKYAQHIDLVVLFDTGTGNKGKLLNVKHIVEVKWFDLCLALTALHCFTGCDTIRAFVRKGKITLLKV